MKKVAGECLSGILVILSVLIPHLIFGEYVASTSEWFANSAAKIASMALTALLLAAALHYFASRICRYLDSK